ncbi:unnamed protein product [Lymnaea stagnalis]|uniref:Major facilitator superfamily (MFS) profile domain-containing protein n=1 Tax=Lymnaea stagnalis TaxID=6523 RepID=A0AAV2HC60_LYMST
MTLENIFEDVGGLNKFQLLMILGIYCLKIPSGWSMMQMSFAGLVPSFLCVTDTDVTPYELEGDPLHGMTNSTLNVCQVNGSACSHYEFLGAAHSIVSEWNLVCDKKWVKATVTSIQMAGVLVGAATSGQLGDYFGRKKTTYGFFLAHLFFNVIAAFSVNWEMFACARFLIGITIGSSLVMTVPYCSEYLPPKWRSLVPVIPVWSIGTSLFALAAYFLQDWAHLHFALVALCVPWLFGYFYFPESVRWLAVQGRIKEAYKVVEQMARTNGKLVPPYTMATLQEIDKTEREGRKSGKTYSYIDVFRGRQMAKISIIFCFQWMTISMVFYGLSFGVSSFAGNLYLNIFIMASVEIPTNLSVLYWNNRFGRRKTTSTFLMLSCLSSFGCLAARFAAPENLKQEIMSGLSLTAKLGVASGWVSTQVWVGECYPTVIRSLGYGVVNTAARIGGILAPFAINLDDNAIVSYVVMGCLLLVSVTLLTLIPETNNTALQDSVRMAASNHVIIVPETPTSGVFKTSSFEDLENVSGTQMNHFKTPEKCTGNCVDDVKNVSDVIDSGNTNHRDIHIGNSSCNDKMGNSNKGDDSAALTSSEQSGIYENVEETMCAQTGENTRITQSDVATLIAGNCERKAVSEKPNTKLSKASQFAVATHEQKCCANIDNVVEKLVSDNDQPIKVLDEFDNHGFVYDSRL